MHNEFNLAPKAQPVLTSYTLTGSWNAGSLVTTSTNNFVGICISYTKGSETGLQLKVEGTLDVSLGLQATVAAATNWYQRTAESTASGTTTATLQIYEYTATGNYTTVIYPIKGDGVRISVQADTIGGSPGTVSISAVTSWV